MDCILGYIFILLSLYLSKTATLKWFFKKYFASLLLSGIIGVDTTIHIEEDKMETETTLAKVIDIADEKMRYDAVCKRLLSEKYILAWIMKYCMKEFAAYPIKEIASHYISGTPQISEVFLSPDETNASRIDGTGMEDITITEGTITYDIRFFAKTPDSEDLIRLIVNVEAQNDFYPGYPLIKRALYYCSRMISAQYGTEFSNSHYEKIKKVYSIWICMNQPEKRKSSITQYSIKEYNLYGKVTETKENYDLLTAVMICLGKEDKENSEEQNQLIRLLNILFSGEIDKGRKKKVLEEDFQIPITQEIEREVSEMCNLSKGIEEKGIQQGLQQGIQQGLQQGMQQGLQQGMQQGLQQGEARINALNMILLNAGRFEDLKRAITDANYQTQLMEELLPKELH